MQKKTMQLYDLIFNKKLISLESNKSQFLLYDIFNWNILLFAEKQEGLENVFLLKNPFSSETSKMFLIRDTYKSNYYFITENYPNIKHIFDADNINLHLMYLSILEDINNEECSYICNQLALSFIDVYDKSNEEKCLEYAYDIFNKLYQLYNDVIFYLNACQVMYRQNKLDKECKTKIVEILHNSNLNFVKLACYILLNDEHNAKYYYDNLKDEEKVGIVNFPIMKIAEYIK